MTSPNNAVDLARTLAGTPAIGHVLTHENFRGQRVPIGVSVLAIGLIVVIVVFFPTGVAGWFARMRRRTTPVASAPVESTQ